jgi:hypothetical protein
MTRTTCVNNVFVVLAVLSLSGGAGAGDRYDDSLSLRLPAALSRFSGYADVAAVGNASAGSKWSTSINPASTAWQPVTTPLRLGLVPQVSYIPFDEGTDIWVFTESVLWQTERWGTFLPAAAQVRTDDGPTRQGPEFGFDLDYFQIQWGIRPVDDWALGLNFNYSKSEVTFSQGGIELAHSDTDSYDLRAGLLHGLSDRWRVGLVVDYGWSESDNRGLDFSTGVPVPVTSRSVGHQVIVRPGVSYEYAPDSTVFLDYQYAWFGDETGHLELHRFMGGVDHQLFKGVFVRGGAMVDDTGWVSWSAGIGVSPAKWVSIDIAYQHGMFPELGEELGNSDTLTLSASFSL